MRLYKIKVDESDLICVWAIFYLDCIFLFTKKIFQCTINMHSR